MSCVFCDIVAHRAPASVVLDDEHVLAFMDLRPLTPGHLLVIPKPHAAYLADYDEELAARVFRIAHRLTAAVRASGLRCEGVNLFLADGEAAFQEVFHSHLHVIPRFRGDGFRIKAIRTRPNRAELDRTAEKISTRLSS